MGLLKGLLASDHRQTLDFFAVGLRDVSGPAVDTQELLYNASVLAHYAQVMHRCRRKPMVRSRRPTPSAPSSTTSFWTPLSVSPLCQ